MDGLFLQTVFLSTLFAVLANIRWRRKKKRTSLLESVWTEEKVRALLDRELAKADYHHMIELAKLRRSLEHKTPVDLIPSNKGAPPAKK
jgi:hypothetical protein